MAQTHLHTGAAVTILVSAANDSIQFARLNTTAVAGKIGFDYDAIEDVRIAVSELCGTVIACAEPNSELRIEVTGDAQRLAVTGRAAMAPGRSLERDELSDQVLSVVTDDYGYGYDESNGVISFHMSRAARAHRDVSTDREEEAVLFREFAESRSVEARNRIVEQYAGLAAALARRFDRRGEPLEDLIQVANLALVGAVERFDPTQGAAFSSFATPTVLGELKRHFRDKTWSVKVPRGLKELHLRIGPAVADLHATFGRGPTVPELAEHLAVSEDDVIEAMEAGAAYRPGSLAQPDVSGEARDDRALAEAEPGYGDVEARMTVRTLMAQLPERERTIVYLRYFEGLTQSEIADRIGVSQVHVSRLLREALSRLAATAPQA